MTDPQSIVIVILAVVTFLCCKDAIRNQKDADRFRFLQKNMTFYDTDESDGPVLAGVSKRIWYHATDSVSYPLEGMVDESK